MAQKEAAVSVTSDQEEPHAQEANAEPPALDQEVAVEQPGMVGVETMAEEQATAPVIETKEDVKGEPAQEGVVGQPEVVGVQTVPVTPAPAAAVVIVAGGTMFGPAPVGCECRNCHKQIVTRTEKQNGSCTWIAVIILVILFWPLAWLPCCMDDCKDTVHYCPSCGMNLGENKK